MLGADFKFIYMVKNAAASDIAAGNVLASGNITPINPGTDQYHILEFSTQQTFGNGEDFFIQLELKELEIAKLSPAFLNWDNGLNTPATHMMTHSAIRPFINNDAYVCRMLFDDLFSHLAYVIGATDAERHAWYVGGLEPLVASLNVGDILAAADFLSGFTGASLAAAFGKGTDAQWQQLLDHVNMMAGPHLKKFPR